MAEGLHFPGVWLTLHDSESTELEFELRANLIIVPVEVKNSVGRFILDTGASSTVVGKEFAKSIELDAPRRYVGHGAGGDVETDLGRLDSLSVGPRQRRDMTVAVMDLDAINEHIGGGIDGVLGFDFFGAGRLVIDYPQRRVRIERPVAALSLAPRFRIDAELFVAEDVGFALQRPDGWRFNTRTPLPDVAVVIEHPAGAEVHVQLSRLPGLSLEQAIPAVRAGVVAQVEEFEEMESAMTTRDKQPLYRLEYTGREKGAAKRFRVEAMLVDERLILLSYEASADSFPRFEGDFAKIAASARVSGRRPEPR
jgi:hypothetical protein